MSQYKSYLFSYRHDGAEWGFEIEATSPEDAKQRVSRLAFASYDGEVIARVPASLGPLARIGVAMRNLFAAQHP